ncbi:MAG: DegT/DnrJ/EryC1/StrS family aminotransferase [Candidatus Omnitrophota bacterium]
MKIPLIDLVRQYNPIKEEIGSAVRAVLEKGVFILGENVENLECEMASYCGTRYAVAVANGTDALELSLKALGIGKGDEVITTPFTFIATVEAICANSAKPVLVDIEEETYNINPSLIEKKINSRTKAIIPVHLFGNPCDMDSIMSIAAKYGLKVIEDCAQSIGAEFNSRKVGGFAEAGCFSFFPTKNLGCYGDGGMIAVNSKGTADRIRALRVHGQTGRYIHEFEGRNSRLDELQSAILRVKMKYLDNYNELRRKNARLYDSFFKDSDLVSGLVTPTEPKGRKHVYNIYSIRVKKRDELKDFLAEREIAAAIYYPVPLHLQKVYGSLGYKKGDLPVSEKVSGDILALPVFPELEEEEIRFVAKNILEFLRRG